MSYRLEAVTSRLEDIGVVQAGLLENAGFSTTPSITHEHVPSHCINTDGGVVITNDSKAVIKSTSAPGDTEVEHLPNPIEEFDNFMSMTVETYIRLSQELGNDVGRQAVLLRDGFREQRKILVLSSKIAKPSAAAFQKLLRPMEECAAGVVEVKDSSGIQNRNGSINIHHDHLNTVADGVGVLGWICVEMRPFRHVDQYLDCARYFGDRVIKEYKEK